jgi:hypothetical protein
MTHTLHREGSVESLKKDYLMYARCSRGINLEGAEPKLRRIVEIVFDEGPTASGASEHNVTMVNGRWNRESALAYQKGTHGFHCCFKDREKMKRVLERLKEEDLGISIVVSGLINEVMAMGREVGLRPHTINLSLGVWGKTDLLPDPAVRQLETMCGHSLVASKLIKKAMAEVRAGTKTPEEAARMIALPCKCGIVNTALAKELLAQTAGLDRAVSESHV